MYEDTGLAYGKHRCSSGQFTGKVFISTPRTPGRCPPVEVHTSHRMHSQDQIVHTRLRPPVEIDAKAAASRPAAASGSVGDREQRPGARSVREGIRYRPALGRLAPVHHPRPESRREDLQVARGCVATNCGQRFYGRGAVRSDGASPSSQARPAELPSSAVGARPRLRHVARPRLVALAQPVRTDARAVDGEAHAYRGGGGRGGRG